MLGHHQRRHSIGHRESIWKRGSGDGEWDEFICEGEREHRRRVGAGEYEDDGEQSAWSWRGIDDGRWVYY